MGDVISAHLDEGKRDMIFARTREVTEEFSQLYEQQYAVALFNSVRYELEGGGGAQGQLLHRKDPLAGKSIFSGGLFQYLEENKKWRNRFVYVDETYKISFYENKQAHDRGLHPKGTLSCAGYKALTSMAEYTQLLNTSLPGVKAKVSSSPVVRCASQFPLILWHPYGRHHYFCVFTEKEQKKWHAVLQDCVRHSNNGLSEDCKVETPAFTDTVRLHRQRHGHYGTWDLMCGAPPQILANLVMETLHPELRNLIGPRLKGKLQQKQRSWMLISDAVYRQVLAQTQSRYEALLQACEGRRPSLDAALRTDMDQIITSREHVSCKLRAVVLPRAEQLLRGSVQPYLGSILEALMEPTSRGFSEVREVLFRELVEVSKNTLNGGGKEKMGEHMEKISILAFHPVKMQSCYEKMDQLSLEGLQQRFHLSSPSVFIQRAQVLMREQMDNAVYTFEQLLWQSLESQAGEELCKITQRCQDRVLKKYDYDSSTVRKKFFREALLQIIIPYMLKHLTPSCSPEFPRFQEMIFEDFSRFILVENVFEELVLQSVTKDIMMAVKEAAVQRRHNLYRDSMVLTSSDPNLHLLGEQPGVDWAAQLGVGGHDLEGGGGGGRSSGRKRRQVVSMIQLEGMPLLPYESCLEVPGVELIPEEGEGEEVRDHGGGGAEPEERPKTPKSPDSVDGIRDLINPVVTVALPVSLEEAARHSNGMEAGAGTISLGDGVEEEVTLIRTVVEEVHARSPAGKSGQEGEEQLAGSCHQEVESEEGELFTDNAAQEVEIAEQEEDSDQVTECVSEVESSPRCHDDSGFQSPTNEGLDENEAQPIVADPEEVVVTLDEEMSDVLNQSESRDPPPSTKIVSEIAAVLL